MKTRILYPSLWSDDHVLELSKDGKVLLFNLLTTPYLGLSKYLKCGDKQAMFMTGLNRTELTKAQGELEACNIHYFDGWYCLECEYAYLDYQGQAKVMQSKESEIAALPPHVMAHFETISSSQEFKGLETSYEGVVNTPKSKPKPKTNKEESVRGELAEWIFEYNKARGTNYKPIDGLLSNFSYWRGVYSLEEMKQAVHKINGHSWLNESAKPELLLRQSDTKGQPTDRIGELLNHRIVRTNTPVISPF